MSDNPDESHMIEFIERECQRAAVAVKVAEATHHAWAARLLAAYDGMTKRRDEALEKNREDMLSEALEKKREDMRDVGFKPEVI
jgi:transcriptional regulator of met regulon